jgi:hypothetical protein
MGDDAMDRARSSTILALALAALLGSASLAAAQQQQAVTFKAIEDDSTVIQPWNLTVDRIEDMDLVDGSGNDIGDIEAVLTDASGQPAAVAAEVGGFLGIGDKEVIVGLDQLRVNGEHLVTTLSKEQLEALPEWDD